MSQTAPRGTPGVPTETLAGKPSQDEQRLRDGTAPATPPLLRRRARLVRRRAARRGLDDAVPGGARGGAPHACRGARSSATASSPRSPAAPVPPAQPARSAPRTASRSSCRATGSSPAGGIGGYGELGVEYKRRLLALEGNGLSDDLRSELAAIAPKRGCCRLAEISALFHSAGTIHLRGRGEVALHLDLATSGVARRAFSLLRELGIHSEIRTYSRRAFDRATRYQLHVTGDEPRSAVLVEAGVLDSRHAPLERPPKRVVGRACCRGAYLRGALLGGGSLSGPRSPHLELRTTSLEGAEFLRSRRRGERRARSASSTAAATPPRTRRASTRSRPCSTRAGATDTVLAFEERSIVAAARERGEPARERRPRQPRPHEPRGAGAARGGPRAPGRRHARAAARPPVRGRAAAAPPPDAAAARARGEVRAAEHARPPSTAGSRSSQDARLERNADAREAVDPTSLHWRVCARPAPDSDPVRRRHGARRAGGGAPRRLPLRMTVLRCRARTGSESDAGRARTRRVKSTHRLMARHFASFTSVATDATPPRRASVRFSAMQAALADLKERVGEIQDLDRRRRRCSAGTSR